MKIQKHLSVPSLMKIKQEWQHSEECMCRLRNIAMRDYPESVTTGQTDGQTDTGKSYPYVPLCFAGDKQEAQRATYRAPEYNVPPFWRTSQGGHLVFPIGPKNTNFVEDVEILLPVKFRWILFSGFRAEVEKCLSQSEARAAILFFRSVWKTQTW